MKQIKNYTLKVQIKGKEVESIRTHSVRLFATHLRCLNFQNDTIVYLRVSYGKKIDSFGKFTTFYNDGFYENKTDLFNAFQAFKDEN